MKKKKTKYLPRVNITNIKESYKWNLCQEWNFEFIGMYSKMATRRNG